MHSGNTGRADTKGPDRRFLLILALYFVVLHSLFLAYDHSGNFASFYRVDRSDNRVDAMDHLFATNNLAEFSAAIITNNIILGEYIVQTGLFKIGGALAVELFQIALQLGSVLAVYRIARLVGSSPLMSLISALLYASLPHSIAFPHQFSSEAIGTPLIVLTVWLVAEYLISGISWRWLVFAGFICGLAACIRPVMIPLPACLALCIIARRGSNALRGAIGMVTAGALPPLMLALFFFAASHQVSLGNTMSGMGYNLYLRVMRITQGLPADEQRRVSDQYFSGKMNEECIGDPLFSGGNTCVLPLPEFITFTLHHPVGSVRFIVRDLTTFIAKSGMSSLTANYLELSPDNDGKIKDYKSGWHAVWDSQGLYAALVMVLNASPITAILELVGSAIFVILFACYLTGCRVIWRSDSRAMISRPRMIVLTALALLPFYMFATSEVSAYMLSRYRSPCEFAICILAVMGGAALTGRLHKSSRPVP